MSISLCPTCGKLRGGVVGPNRCVCQSCVLLNEIRELAREINPPEAMQHYRPIGMACKDARFEMLWYCRAAMIEPESGVTCPNCLAMLANRQIIQARTIPADEPTVIS